MGNNNATANLTEEESSKLETHGTSPMESVPVENTQDQVFLAGEGKDGDKEKESFTDGNICKETPETEPQSKELVEDPKVKNVEEEMHPSGLESSVMEIDEQIQKQILVAEGVETACEATEVEDLSMIGTQSVVNELNTTEFGNEEKPCVIDETVGTEAKMINKSLEEIVPAEEAVKLDQEIGMEQRTGFPGIDPQEILNLDYRVLDDDDEVTNEGKADQEISKPGSQESNVILETGFEVFEEEKGKELGREASLKRMTRCRSLPVSHNTRVTEESVVQQLVSEIAFPSRNKMGLEKGNMPETLLVSCVGSNKAQETTEAITESNKDAIIELQRSPTFGSDLRIKERNDESTEKIPLLCEDMTETYEAIIDVEERTVMLKRSETEKTRGIELSLGLSMKPSRSSEADDSFKETKGSGDSFVDKKATTYDTLVVSCVGSNIPQETAEAITEGNKEARFEMRSPSLRIEERSDQSVEKTLLLCQDKTETNEATVDVDKKNVMLKRSVSEKSRGFELSLGLSMKPSESSEAEGSFKETKDSGDNLLDKKASWGSMKGRVRKRSKSSLFGTCLCCATAIS
ncbi:hypothetical protein EUTSA_v10024777mg [Eutrema salsugineum]|uniref:Uncharacterized protein n=1 Tax=Eutrema salsugineum TaxID=72664 RepID=V4P907_EUTSA|nr:hypothetical protein EUTSA_v10024777mg [Eutrema salsugineum]